ncbi:phage portal protein [Acidovorax sp. NCPPB 3576]|uniref:phage portal protein n=1 Tax=Acidovorax sp. NCPPB 3576 TaxID=2940488 RepID=UPI00234990F3|nr:phage portal protein [Acidovorax sp. NCPPB 3576]WCM86654.1 phage portal protein [Acidovorax sp. NCPPB 3576]
MRADLKALADAVIKAVRAKMAPLMKRLDDIDTAIKELPESVSKQLAERVQAAVAEIPRPKDGEPGASVTVEELAPMVVEEVAQQVSKAVQELPAPKDGVSVTPDDVAPMLAELVTKAVADIPAPKDGKDADPEVVAELVAKAVAAIPLPQDGRSVTADDVAPLVVQEVAKAVAEIPRPKDGESLPAEEVQRMVDEAVTKALSAVAVPKDGEPGRDALQLELQPEIDLEKSYARGTYARHAGGLWRAFEATKGLHGWECVVEGIADLRIDQDGREFTVVARTSSGAEVSKSIKVAALVDKGVFKAGTDYEAGDGVTWGGSYFIAQKDAPIGHPGEPGSNGWRLAVKRGRDAGKGIAV